MDIVNENNEQILSIALGILISILFWFFYCSPTIIIEKQA